MTSANGALRAKTRGSWLIMNWPLGITGDCFDRDKTVEAPVVAFRCPCATYSQALKESGGFPEGDWS